ncbi:MAG: hypoxanthine phosphoribosyltransferase [Alistipes sp.]|jgi:hypoxanthine phosphoribosyltransferase|nr:hypoxanthine phosphoribosyltransferase [Alistipes sp.]
MSRHKRIKIHDREFRVLIPSSEIEAAIDRLAARINADYAARAAVQPPLFLGVLNGAFMFVAELLRRIEFHCEISFVKLASYHGLGSSGKISELIGLKNNVEGRDVIILEDVVDSGESMEHLLRSLAGHRPASVEIATLFFKPGAFTRDFPVRYRAIETVNEFIVGFGLDYNELGRNLKDIYVVVDD